MPNKSPANKSRVTGIDHISIRVSDYKKSKKHKPRIGDIGLHHYAFQLRSRKDVDALQAFLEGEKVPIVDPADEYYEDYYAVSFSTPTDSSSRA